MRLVASNPDAMGDMILRQPLYAALAEAGHELLLIVRSATAPVARLVAPSAQLLEFPVDPSTPRERDPAACRLRGSLPPARRPRPLLREARESSPVAVRVRWARHRRPWP